MNVARLAMLARVGALAATVIGLVGCAARAPARSSVAILEVRGADPDEQRAWQERVEGLARARRLDVIDADGYWLMARRLGAQTLTAPDVARVARAVGATAVVHGRIDRARRRGKARRKARRAREVVTIYVRDGESGRVIEKHRVRPGRGRAARRSEAALDRSLLAGLDVPATPTVAAKRADPPAGKVTAKKNAAKKPVAKKPAAKTTAKTTAKKPTAKKPAMAASASAGSAAKGAPSVRYDEEGQAIDEERPPPPPR